MKRFSLLAGLCIAAVTASPALAQDTDAQETQTRPRTQINRQEGNQSTSNIDSATRGPLFRASQLTGMNIQNNEGKAVGEINDLVIDPSSGRIRYVAVTYGGFLGIGNKMFAVPFEAFKFQRDPNDADENIVVLNVTEQQLEGAVGFDEDNWPNFGDTEFTSELDRRYGIERQRRTERRRRNRDANVEVEVDPSGVDVDVEGDREPR